MEASGWWTLFISILRLGGNVGSDEESNTCDSEIEESIDELDVECERVNEGIVEDRSREDGEGVKTETSERDAEQYESGADDLEHTNRFDDEQRVVANKRRGE